MRRPLFGDAADLEGRTSPITRAAGPRRGIINATPAIPTSSCGHPRVSSGRPDAPARAPTSRPASTQTRRATTAGRKVAPRRLFTRRASRAVQTAPPIQAAPRVRREPGASESAQIGRADVDYDAPLKLARPPAALASLGGVFAGDTSGRPPMGGRVAQPAHAKLFAPRLQPRRATKGATRDTFTSPKDLPDAYEAALYRDLCGPRRRRGVLAGETDDEPHTEHT